MVGYLHKINNGVSQSNLRHDYERYSHHKFYVSCFMVNDIHNGKHGDRTAEYAKPHKGRLTYSPFVSPCRPLVIYANSAGDRRDQ